MYKELFGKYFLCKMKDEVREIVILAAIPSEYFSDEGFNQYLQAGGQQTPGATINNKNNYLSFWVKDKTTKETFRVSEYDMLVETSDMNDGEVEALKTEYEDRVLEEERIEKYGELGFDKHYYKCKDIGMGDEEALRSVIDLIKIKIDEDGK